MPMNPAPPVMIDFMRGPAPKEGTLGVQNLLVQFDDFSRVFLPGKCRCAFDAGISAACPPIRLFASFSQELQHGLCPALDVADAAVRRRITTHFPESGNIADDDGVS